MKQLEVYFRSDRKAEQQVPAQRLDRVRQTFRRRLSDQLEEVFYRACTENDMRTASCLYAIIEDMNSRRNQQHGLERRISDEALARAKEALEQCRALNPRRMQAPATEIGSDGSQHAA